ncbi:Septin-interacting protein 1 [Papilio xuthus]|uniref:Septin-interacting protein 1 n=1 Tax=Papilio xuthus TaxID=66420 RepID=A0A194Q5P5_PAPXU|nr:Septin-interacting protein 1 [Papilio xuthus]
MSDDEVIRFEITDYDLDNEFNPNRQRKAKKEHQIYGVWAKDSDEEDNEDNIRQRSRKQKDFTAPIGFVAGGVQQAGKKKDPNKELESKEASTSRPLIVDSSDEDDNDEPLPTDTAGIRRLGQGLKPANLGGSVGAWEKHTKGIGAKLLLQMGYQPGKGLGKELQGISAPVEATVRKGRGAIGAYGPEKSTQKAKKEEEKRLKEKEDQEKGTSEKNYNWKKSHKGRYFYRDAADVIQEGKPTMHTIGSSELARVPVIDMTGKQKRVLSGYHALAAAAPRYEHEPRRQLRHFAAPQLTHNLQLVVDSCEQDIIQNARELQAAEDEIVVLERDLEECNIKLQEQDVVIDKVQTITHRIEELNKPDLSLEKAYEVLEDLMESFPVEYEMFGLGTIGGTIVSPLISALLAQWEPLQCPDEPVPVFLKWKKLLTEPAYNSLLWQHFMPRITSAAEVWNPRRPEAMLAVFERWSAACPEWILQTCAGRSVVPRLLAAVRAWDPTGEHLVYLDECFGSATNI